MTVKQADELFTAALKIEYHAGTDAALYDWLPHQVRTVPSPSSYCSRFKSLRDSAHARDPSQALPAQPLGGA